MTDAALTLQAAIFAALSAAPPIGASVYDAVPQGTAFPHIEIAGGWVADWSAALMQGEEHTVEIHVWSRTGGFTEARTLMAAVKARLHEVSLSLTGALLIDIRYAGADLFTDADGETRHGIVRFAATTTV